MIFFAALVTIILLLAKIFGLIAISWLAVFSPLVVAVVILFILGVLVAILG